MVQNKIYQTVNPAIISFVIKENYRGLMATCRYAVIICLNFHVFLLFCLILKGKAKGTGGTESLVSSVRGNR